MQRDYVPWLQGMQQYAPGSGQGTLTQQRCEQGAKGPRGEASPCRLGVWEHGPEVGHLSQSKLPLIQSTGPTPPPGATIIPVTRRHSFPMNQFFASGYQSIGASASASVLPMNIQD